jgi:tetratricopeptide (TPR) repeat protein
MYAMKHTSNRSIGVVIASVVAISCALIVRARVAADYARSKAAYTRYLERERLKAKAETQAHNNERGVALLRAEVQAHPRDVQARWRLVSALQRLKMLNDALPQLQEIARLDPASVDPVVAEANTQLFLHRYREAEQDYRNITGRWPRNVDGWQGLAAALYHQRRYNEAGIAGQRALLLDPGDLGNRYIVASSGLEYALEFPNEPEAQQALAIARKLLSGMAKDDPESGDVQYKLGLVYFLGHKTPAALPYLRRAAELLPDRVSVVSDLAEILISAGNYAEARGLLLRSIPRMPKAAGVYNLLSESYQYDRDAASIQAAIRAGLTATQLAPNTPSYWDRLALSYLKAQDFARARQAFERSAVLDPNRSYPYQQLAALYSRTGDARRASVAAQMASHMEANTETLRHIESLSAQYPGDTNLLLIRADRYRDLKMNGPARELYRQILTMQPDSAAAAQGLAAIDHPSVRKQGTP